MTSIEKIIARLTDIKGSVIEDKLRTEALARGASTVLKLRENAQKTGISKKQKKSATKLRFYQQSMG